MDAPLEDQQNAYSEQIAAELHEVADKYVQHPRFLVEEMAMLLGTITAQISRKGDGYLPSRFELFKRCIFVSNLMWNAAWLMRKHLRQESKKNAKRSSDLD